MALEMKFGSDPKKNAALVVLLLILAFVFYENVLSTPDFSASLPAASVPRPTPAPATPITPASAAPAKRPTADRRSMEFRPVLGSARPEDRPDPMKVDPTLRLELLARLEKVQFQGGQRSLFDFSNTLVPSAPGPAVPKIIPTAKKTPPLPRFIGPMEEPPKPVPPPPPPPPTAPPIPLKFYGYSSAPKSIQRKAFFLDGENILVGGEGDTLKQRYKIIRIGLTSVTMEDLQFSQQQSLPIVPEPLGGGY